MFLWGLIFHYLDNFFAIKKNIVEAQEFNFWFDFLYKELGVEVDQPKKIYKYKVKFWL